MLNDTTHHTATPPRTIARAVAFYVIQSACLPLATAGYIVFLIALMRYSRATGVSTTTLATLYTRWMQHYLGTRRDMAAVRLAMALPGGAPLAMRLTAVGTLLAHRLTGYVPRTYRYPYEGTPPLMHEPAARTTYFDAALARHLPAVTQVVNLGAGWDTRAYRLPARIRCFEVDLPRTQAEKRRMIAAAGLDPARVTFVPANFLTDDWLENLTRAGFDPSQPTFFLWEGVTMYLDRAAVEGTLRKIAATAPGSAVAFNYFHADLLTAGSPYWRYARATTNAVGEPLRFGIPGASPAREGVVAFLAACGLVMEEQRNIGPETARKPARMGFTTAVVPPRSGAPTPVPSLPDSFRRTM